MGCRMQVKAPLAAYFKIFSNSNLSSVGNINRLKELYSFEALFLCYSVKQGCQMIFLKPENLRGGALCHKFTFYKRIST